MPRIEVVFYKDDQGRVPVLEWLRDLQRRDKRGYAKCVVRIRRLAESGHELRRPEADYLRDGIYFGRLHDVILLYSKSESYPWNPQYAAYDEKYLQTH